LARRSRTARTTSPEEVRLVIEDSPAALLEPAPEAEGAEGPRPPPRIGRWQTFVGVGVGTELLTLLLLLAFSKHRGWF
jgi:hypothetical protein